MTTMSPRSKMLRILLWLLPAMLAAGMWAISATFGSFSIGHFSFGDRLVVVSSSNWRALEIAVVRDPQYVREGGYSVLPKSHAPIMGIYIGPVAGPGTSTTLVLLPYYFLLLLSLFLAWRPVRRIVDKRPEPRGFEVGRREEPEAEG